MMSLMKILKTLIKSNCSILWRLTLNCRLEFVELLLVLLTVAALAIPVSLNIIIFELFDVDPLIISDVSSIPSNLRKSETFIRAVDSPTESPS